jgi:8-oxo-dGTP pyrophosphatase MutT (NUDIX family)
MARQAAGDLQRKDVVTAFLRHGGKVLIVRRSRRVGSYRGRWSGISGYLEDKTPLMQAIREIREETGIEEGDLTLVASGPALEVLDQGLSTLWVVHPFLFDVMDRSRVYLDWENVEARWVSPSDIGGYSTVPALTDALAACLAEGGAGTHG